MRNIWDVPSSEYKETIPRGVVLNGAKVLLFNKTRTQKEKSNIFLSLLVWMSQRSQGCHKIRHYPLNLDLKVWCSNIEQS